MGLPPSELTISSGMCLFGYLRQVGISLASMPLLTGLSLTGISSRTECPIERQPRSTTSRYSPRPKLLVPAVWSNFGGGPVRWLRIFFCLPNYFFNFKVVTLFCPRSSPRPKCSMIHGVHRTGATRIGKCMDVAKFKNTKF